MFKKYLLAYIIILLLACLIFNISACATNINCIQPDEPTLTIIIPEPSPIHVIPQPGVKTILIPPPGNNVITKEEPIDVEINEENISLLALQSDIYSLINEQRAGKSLEPLEYNFDLQDAVYTRAKEISVQFAHMRPNGKDFGTVIGANIEFEVAGENLLLIDKPIANAKTIVETWMNSEGHRQNILSEKYNNTAIGVYEYNNVIYVAQIFLG